MAWNPSPEVITATLAELAKRMDMSPFDVVFACQEMDVFPVTTHDGQEFESRVDLEAYLGTLRDDLTALGDCTVEWTEREAEKVARALGVPVSEMMEERS
jgi:hypothetical protein